MGQNEDDARPMEKHCVRSQCGEWIDHARIYPVLIIDEITGFWLCPKCKASYGKDAQEPYDPSIQDDVE